MNRFHELAQRVTQRLRDDPELRCDVAHELRVHLEDSAREFREAGCAEEEAEQQALKALGNPDELAEQLWQANRGRMRWRAAARWAARAALLPAAILVTLAVPMGGLMQLRGGIIQLMGMVGMVSVADGEALWAPSPPPSGVSADQRFILEGDPAAEEFWRRQKAIADRWPDNPIYYGNFVVSWLAAHSQALGTDGSPDEATRQQALAILDRGEKLEPDNGFYNLTKASLLLRWSALTEDDPQRRYEVVGRNGSTENRECLKLTIRDPDRFRRGLAELQRGLGKPVLSGHAFDMLRARESLLPPPRRLVDHVQRVGMEVGVLLPDMTDYRQLGTTAAAYALYEADAGRAKSAAQWAELGPRLAARLGAQSQCLVELLVAQAMDVTARGHAVQVYRTLNQPEPAQRATAGLVESFTHFNQAWQHGQEMDQTTLRHAGVLASLLVPAVPGYKVDFEPLRSAEYAVADTAGLMVLLLLLDVVALVVGGAAGVSLLRHRGREDGPILLWVGWRRLGSILTWAVVVPLAVYGLYSQADLLGGRQYGIPFAGQRVLVEMLLLATVMIGLLLTLTARAVRERAAELGLAVPPPLRLDDRRWLRLVGLALVLAAVAYVAAWYCQTDYVRVPSGPSWRGPLGAWGVLAIVAMLLFNLGWAVTSAGRLARLRDGLALYRRSLLRSMMPMVCGAVIVLGLSCSWWLARTEAGAVQRALRPGCGNFTDEVEYSNGRQLRDRFRQLSQQFGGGAAATAHTDSVARR